EIHVFTPSGRRVQLPAESTPVDLAYELDTHLGDQCVAALVNGRLVPLSAPLSDGDVVDILTRHDELPTDVPQPDDAAGTDPGTDVDDDPGDDPPGPSRDWLAFVKTPQARLEISRWFEGYDQASPASPAQKVRLGLAAVGLALRRRDRRHAPEVPLPRPDGPPVHHVHMARLYSVHAHITSAALTSVYHEPSAH